MGQLDVRFAAVPAPARIGLALGGGFARGLAHIGVLAVLPDGQDHVATVSQNRLLVDGAISTEVPALLARLLGATRVISLHLPMQGAAAMPTNMFHVINRCFQILHSRTEITWRQHSDLVIEPEVRGMEWDAFDSAMQLVKAGEEAARQALPRIQEWMAAAQPLAAAEPVTPNSKSP